MRILVIEDEQEIRNFLIPALREECFEVDEAHDGERGSFMARVSDYDLVLLDNMLPRKEGLQVCREIRQAGKTCPILVLSVRSDTREKAGLLDAGADDYLAKPFSLIELMARIRALMRRPSRIEGDVLEVGDIVLDTRKRTIQRAGKDIYLTRKEFMLLEYLMRNKGTVLSRGMIMEHVWDMNADPFSNTIEAHVLSLRKKIDDKGKKKIVKTVPGRGYVVE